MRDLINLVEMASTTRYGYHATFARNLASIVKQGLIPNGSEPNFDGYPIDGRLYVALSVDAANFYIETLSEAYEEECVLLRFPIASIKLFRDEYGNPEDRYTLMSIAPQLLEIERDGRWEKIS